MPAYNSLVFLPSCFLTFVQDMHYLTSGLDKATTWTQNMFLECFCCPWNLNYSLFHILQRNKWNQDCFSHKHLPDFHMKILIAVCESVFAQGQNEQRPVFVLSWFLARLYPSLLKQSLPYSNRKKMEQGRCIFLTKGGELLCSRTIFQLLWLMLLQDVGKSSDNTWWCYFIACLWIHRVSRSR